jgi:hypothetical protein
LSGSPCIERREEPHPHESEHEEQRSSGEDRHLEKADKNREVHQSFDGLAVVGST